MSLEPEIKKSRIHSSNSSLNSNSSSGSIKPRISLFENEKDVMLQIFEEYHNQKYEICGNLTITDDNKLTDITYNKRNADKNKKKYEERNPDDKRERNNCEYSKYSTAIWHTHPNKIYPSSEDVLKVLKHPSISYSFIIGCYGYFKIIGISDIAIQFNETEKELLTKELNEYYSPTTLRGTLFIKEKMIPFLKGLNKFLKEIIETKGMSSQIKFKIKYFLYNKKPRKLC